MLTDADHQQPMFPQVAGLRGWWGGRVGLYAGCCTSRPAGARGMAGRSRASRWFLGRSRTGTCGHRRAYPELFFQASWVVGGHSSKLVVRVRSPSPAPTPPDVLVKACVTPAGC